MKKLIALLLIFAMVLPVLVSCENNKPSADTTVAQTEPEKEPEGRKSKAYPNSLKVSAYNLLTDSEILLYEAVAKLIAAPEPAKSITLKYGVRTDSFNMIIDIFRANFATHASVIESISYTEADGKITSVMLSEDFDKAAFESEYKTVSKKADEIISSIPLGLSDKEIVFELVDYLVKNTTYTDESETTSVHTALLEGRADSEGFAKALDLLLKKAGISSFTVYGYTENHIYDYATNESEYVYTVTDPKHYWNYLSIWNQWYQIDVSKLYPLWVSGGEMLLNINSLLETNELPYYYHRNGIGDMQVPYHSLWSTIPIEFTTCSQLMDLIETTNLYNMWQYSYHSELTVKFKSALETQKFLDYNEKTVTDITGTEYILFISKKNGEETIANFTPIKATYSTELNYLLQTYRPVYCGTYNSNREVLNSEYISIAYSIPETWLRKDGFHYRFDDSSDYPGFNIAMSVYKLTEIPENFVLDESSVDVLMGGAPYKGEFVSGTTSHGNKYAYYVQTDQYHLRDKYYYVYVQISDKYVINLYLTESIENEDIVLKVIDSVIIIE